MSSQRERFCQLIAFKGLLPADAYREAYNSQGTDETVRVAASQLMNDPEVAVRIERLQRPVIERGIVTLQGHLEKLGELRDFAIQLEQPAPAITAEQLRGKVVGFYVEKVATADGLSLEQLVAGPNTNRASPVKAGPKRKRKR